MTYRTDEDNSQEQLEATQRELNRTRAKLHALELKDKERQLQKEQRRNDGGSSVLWLFRIVFSPIIWIVDVIFGRHHRY